MLTNTNQIKRLLYSFVIAFIFWFFIKSEDTYSVTTSIPLVARNLQEQKTYKEEVPESIIVSLKGSGRAFIWLRFFDNFYEDYKAVIDLSSIADEYNFELDQYYKNNPEKIVLPTSLDLEFVEVISPRNIKINLDQYLVKKVPIMSEIMVTTSAGYIQVGEIFSPDSISIGGPQEIVDNIDFVKTQKDTLVNLVTSIESEFLIINPDTIWSPNYLKELKLLEKLFFENKKNKCSLLTVNKKRSFDQSLKGDFNLKNNLLNRNKKDDLNYIYTGMQIIKPEAFSEFNIKVFSINKIWDILIKSDELYGLESNIDFLHVSTLDIYKKLLKEKFKR